MDMCVRVRRGLVVAGLLLGGIFALSAAFGAPARAETVLTGSETSNPLTSHARRPTLSPSVVPQIGTAA